MKGISINEEESDKSVYCDWLIKHGEPKFRPGDLLMAVSSPAGVVDIDLNGTVLMVKFVALELDRDDGMEEDEEQPDDLPYYVCKTAENFEYIFTEKEVMDLSPDQADCLYKEAMFQGHLPSRWSFDLYDKWL